MGVDTEVAIVGGGPAGSVAALCLRKLGREAVLLERERFPRYRIGESLLPGTLSILSRLGLHERLEAAGFPKKRAATFLWGAGHRPWSFTFSTPKTAPWIFDHAYQVTRAEFDAILLDAAAERGADVRQGVQATDIRTEASGAEVDWKNGSESGTLRSEFTIDAGGSGSILARKGGLRRWDSYYRNMAIWSYFEGGTRYSGDLAGNIFSVSFRDGWIWIIPQKDDIYSVGVVTGLENNARMKELGPEKFYEACLEGCEFARDTLAGARRLDKVRVVRDWAYDSERVSMDRGFLCGDSACFIDPLFSQGVHLAAYSARLAAAGIDHLLDHPGDEGDVHAWYDRSYRAAYDRYHRFLTAFYFHCDEPDSAFWEARRVETGSDDRFDGKEWFQALAGQTEGDGLEDVEAGATVLRALWDHGDGGLSEEFDETRLSLRRVRWAAERMRTFRAMERVRWTSGSAHLEPSFSVDPISFELVREYHLADAAGRQVTAFSMTAAHRELFDGLREEPISYKELTRRLKDSDPPAPPAQILNRLFEEGYLEGVDADGNIVAVEHAMRFGGVGGDDDLI